MTMLSHALADGGDAAALLERSEPVTPERHAAWAAARRGTLGASEAAAALGLADAYLSPVDLWLRKVGLAADEPPTWRMKKGLALEPLLLEEYRQRHGAGCALHPQRYFAGGPRPWLSCTLDALAVPEGGGGPPYAVELKAVTDRRGEWGEPGTAEVPDRYLVQVYHQMAVTGVRLAHVFAAVDDREPRLWVVPWDETVAGRVLAGEDAFWACVEFRTPPTWGRLDAAALAVLHPDCAGEAELDHADLVHVAEWEALRARRAGDDEAIDDLKTRILLTLGNSQWARLPDGRWLRRYRREVPAAAVSYQRKPYFDHHFKIVQRRQDS